MRPCYIILLLALTCASCCRNEDRREQQLLIAYIATDNDLEFDGTPKVEGLRLASKVSKFKILVYVDRNTVNPRLLLLEDGKQTTVAEYEVENSADAAVFARVIRDAAARYPADHYGLLFFSHAGGWLPEGVPSTPPRSRAIGNDRGREMELVDFAAAIPDRFFNYIIFEACFTAGIEVMYELRNKADYVMGSSAEILSPGYRDIYSAGLPCVSCMPNSLTGFAERFFAEVSSKVGDYRSATVSIIETARLEALATAVRQARVAHPDPPPVNPANVQRFDRLSGANYFFDMADYIEQLYPPATAGAILDKIKACVVYKAHTDNFMLSHNGFAINKHCGMTTYIPQPGHENLNTAYNNLAWQKAIKN